MQYILLSVQLISWQIEDVEEASSSKKARKERLSSDAMSDDPNLVTLSRQEASIDLYSS